MAALVLTLTGLVFLGSATQDDPQQQGQHGKQALLAACSFGVMTTGIFTREKTIFFHPVGFSDRTIGRIHQLFRKCHAQII